MLNVAAWFGLLFESWAAPALTMTVTSPFAVGATSKVYVCASTITKFEAVPLVIVRPARLNPVTSALKVTVIGIGLTDVGSGSVVVIVAVGPVAFVMVRLPVPVPVLPA